MQELGVDKKLDILENGYQSIVKIVVYWSDKHWSFFVLAVDKIIWISCNEMPKQWPWFTLSG